jgi:lipooligosaccharide transport system permease protein
MGSEPWYALPLLIPILMLGSLLFWACGLVSVGLVKALDQVNLPTFLFILPMFTLSGTYFPRGNLPGMSRWLAEAPPLSPIVDFLLCLPEYWPWQLLWLIRMVLMAAYWG